MNVLVTVKEVAHFEDDFVIDGHDVDARYLKHTLNEWDNYAIEEAVTLGETYDDVEVIAVTIGPERVEETLRTVLAKGVDRAIRIWDDRLAEASVEFDVGLKTELLARVADTAEPDIVLSGVQAGDVPNGATGVALAERLGYGWAAVVTSVDVDSAAGRTSVRRELEGGVKELTTVELPAVLTIQTGINQPRYASMRGIRQAQRKPLEVKGLNDLELDDTVLDSPLSRDAFTKPDEEGDAEIWSGTPDETANTLAEFLHAEGVVDG